MVELARKGVVVDGGDDANVSGVRGAGVGAGVVDDDEVDHREGGAHQWVDRHGATAAAAAHEVTPVSCHCLEDGQRHLCLRVELAGEGVVVRRLERGVGGVLEEGSDRFSIGLVSVDAHQGLEYRLSCGHCLDTQEIPHRAATSCVRFGRADGP